MFVDHVRCLHNQIQTVHLLKMHAQLTKIISVQIYDTESEQWSYIIVDVIYILASCDQH